MLYSKPQNDCLPHKRRHNYLFYIRKIDKSTAARGLSGIFPRERSRQKAP